MAMTYNSQGAGVATETSGADLAPLCPAVVAAGHVLIGHVGWEGTATAPSTPSGWRLLAGPFVIETSVARHWVFGKIADGTEDGTAISFGSPAVTTQRGARIYSFAGRVSGTIDELVTGFSHISHATDPQMPTVQTSKSGALAVALIYQNDNNTAGDATGESGGNWVEAVAEFVSALTPGLMMQIQTCTPTGDPGTVSGGSVATTNDPCGVIGFQILDEPRPVDELMPELIPSQFVGQVRDLKPIFATQLFLMDDPAPAPRARVVIGYFELTAENGSVPLTDEGVFLFTLHMFQPLPVVGLFS